MEITHGSFFTGYGTFDLACLQNDIKNIFGCDNDLYCKLLYKQHYPDSLFFDDIKEIKNVPYTDILSFGFPCQDISIANTWNKETILINQIRSGLFYEAVRLFKVSRPKFILIENVKALFIKGMENVLFELSESGYNAAWAIIPAESFGAIHKRERVFILCTNTDCINGTETIQILNNAIEKSQTYRKQNKFLQLEYALSAETQLAHYGETSGDDTRLTTRLHEAHRLRTIGNGIYYPIAESFINSIKQFILKKNY